MVFTLGRFCDWVVSDPKVGDDLFRSTTGLFEPAKSGTLYGDMSIFVALPQS